ncbi:MAG TPA: Ig-like domain-containing protein [Micromonospora sp.]
MPSRALLAVVTGTVLALAVTACSSGNGSPGWRDGGGGDGDGGEKKAVASVTISAPATGATDVPASTGIEFDVKEATKAVVELKGADGEAVEGQASADGKSWLPDGQLEYGATYTATVTATGSDGKPATATTTFTTMKKPAKQVRVTSFLGDHQVVGVGMPLIVKFNRAIPQDYRDDLQRRMTVRSNPPQEGAWRWISPTEVRYRPKEFWQANTEISYKVQAGGLPLGDGWYGRADLTIEAKIGSAFVMTVDNRTKQMTVTKDGAVIKTIPVSLGKPSTPSSSGTMIVMEKFKHTVFDTLEELGPEEGYRTEIDFAQRLTYGGEFIHAAPWSEGKQGRVNVSHGCVNVSMANGAWLFERTRIGDPITVRGTERKLQLGNGWTDWNYSFDEWVKGSAIPYEPPADNPDTDASEAPGPTPTA